MLAGLFFFDGSFFRDWTKLLQSKVSAQSSSGLYLFDKSFTSALVRRVSTGSFGFLFNVLLFASLGALGVEVIVDCCGWIWVGWGGEA